MAILHNEGIPFYRDRSLPLLDILTDNNREFQGREDHPYELYLDSTASSTARPRQALDQRLRGALPQNLDEFFRLRFRETLYESVEALQADLDAWLHH